MRNLIFANILCLFFISQNTFAQDGKFSFSLTSPAKTSAGVFKKDGTIVRTLWNNIHYSAGNYTKYWDGKDNLGVTIALPDSTYEIKVVSNNINYTWGGTLGNSSDNMTGSSKHRSKYNCMSGLAFTSNGYGYFCTGYSENKPGYAKFLTSSPQAKINFYNNSATTLNTEFVATDNVNVYWSGFDSYGPKDAGIYTSMVHAMRVSDDAAFTFSKGSSYAIERGITMPSVISKVTFPSTNINTGYITGLAVQKMGSYLFVARATLNQIQVLNKTTGDLIKTLSFTNPRTICVDSNDNLWICTGTNTVNKYIVNSDGTMSNTAIALSGLLNPLAIQVSSNGTTISVADGGNSQQVKFFSTSNGSRTNTLGLAGGYFTEPEVTNDKFYFSDVQGYAVKFRPVFLAYQSDGSFWVGDGGNARVQHFSSSLIFINRILSIGSSYTVYADPNNPTRVWAGPLEFSVDYSQQLSGTTGWKLVRNWGANITSDYYKDGSYSFTNPTTLSNGKTYAFIRKMAGNSLREWVEFPTTGQVRFTGVVRMQPQIMAPDGSIQALIKGPLGGKSIVHRYELTGFTSSNNPIWASSPEIVATTPILTINDPSDILTGNAITSTNKVILWNPDLWLNSTTPFDGYHLAAINRGGNSWLWKTELATHFNYNGPYPEAGYFDIGNNVGLPGGALSVWDRNVITSYHGEFWKNSQTNKYNHYLDNGLALGQFGISGDDSKGDAAAMFAGNALTPMIVPDPNSANSLYMYHGDGSQHSGIHRWKITGLNTVAEQSMMIPFPSGNKPISNFVDLMAGLPFSATLVNNTAGWTRSPLTDYKTSNYDRFNIKTSNQTYNKYINGNDLTAAFESQTIRTNTISRDLGNNNITDSWKITGEVFYPAGNNVNGQFAKQFIEILDSKGKILTVFYIAASGSITSIYGNLAIIASSGGSVIQNLTKKPQFFSVSVSNGMAVFTFSNYTSVTTAISDSTGDWKTPKTLRIRMLRNSLNTPARFQTIGIKDFKFYKDYSITNQPPSANAGTNKMITLPTNSVSLTGSGTDTDGTITGYSWSKISGPATYTIVSPTSAITSISGMVQGTYKFALTVTDNGGATDSDTVQVTLNSATNQPPSANAGTNKVITLPTNSVSLTGSGTDTDGTITGYSWTKISGPVTFTVVSPSSATTAINGLVQGIYKFKLTVTDNDGATDSDTVDVTVNSTVNQPPSANAGTDKNITLPTNSVSLTGSGTDSDGTITGYSWTKISGPATFTIVSPSSATTTINNLLQGTYIFRLNVTDNNGAVDSDDMNIIVNSALTGAINQAPVAIAGTSRTVTLPTKKLKLSGKGYDADGYIKKYKWRKYYGPGKNDITDDDTDTATIGSLQLGTYLYVLTVTDNDDAQATDTLEIIVNDSKNTLGVAGRPAAFGLLGTLDSSISVTPSAQNKVSNVNTISQVKVYPNPVKDIANLNITTIHQHTKISVSLINVSGMLVKYKEINTINNNTVYPLDMSGLSDGVYFIKIIFDDGKFNTIKVIKY